MLPDPLLARFISADTVVPGSGPLTVASLDAVESSAWASGGGGPGNPQDLNRYAYTLNNPLNATDPTGHVAWVAAGFIIGAAIDLGSQLYSNGGDFSKVNVTQTLVSGAVGAVSVLTGGLLPQALTIGKSIIANSVISGVVSFAGANIQNEFQDPALPKADVLTSTITGAALGGLASGLQGIVKGGLQARALRSYNRLSPEDKGWVDTNSIDLGPNVRSFAARMLDITKSMSITISNAGPVLPLTVPSD